VRGLTGARSIWQVSRVPIDERFSLIELVNRTAEADISRAHTDFVANASHELRTPLSSIIGYVETLADPEAKVPRRWPPSSTRPSCARRGASRHWSRT
jgi:two-component system phosphate regulon sensor histidine kinase PhoR